MHFSNEVLLQGRTVWCPHHLCRHVSPLNPCIGLSDGNGRLAPSTAFPSNHWPCKSHARCLAYVLALLSLMRAVSNPWDMQTYSLETNPDPTPS